MPGFGSVGLVKAEKPFLASSAANLSKRDSLKCRRIIQSNFYTNGQTVTLTPIPDSGQEFIGWSGDTNGFASPLAVAMDNSKIITANFTKRPKLKVGTPLEGLVEKGFRLTLNGEFGTAHSILGSTNLLNWSFVGTVTNTYGEVQLTDPVATNLLYRFYRAESQ